MVSITCSHCGASGKAPEKILGQQVRCSKCKQSFLAEGPPQPSVERSPFSLDEEPEPPEDDGEGFPTNDDIGAPTARGASASEDDDEPVVPLRSLRNSRNSGLGEFLAFRRLIAPQLIVILFWLMLVGVLLGSLGAIGLGISMGTVGIPMVAGGVVYLVVGPIAARLWCEVLIVIFRINETLSDIRDDLRRRDER